MHFLGYITALWRVILYIDLRKSRTTEVFFGIWFCDINEEKKLNKIIWHSCIFPHDTKITKWPLKERKYFDHMES